MSLQYEKKCNSAAARLRQDYIRIKKDPIPYVAAEPLPSNILEWPNLEVDAFDNRNRERSQWNRRGQHGTQQSHSEFQKDERNDNVRRRETHRHYVMQGPEDTPYEGGFYHGKLVFPKEFPFKPPSIYMMTPNGRFMTDKKLCLSISDYHPDTWNPAWSVATILTGLLSFMTEDTKTLGSTKTTTDEKRKLAYQSLKYNLEDKVIRELFPDTCKLMKSALEKRKAQRVREERETAGGGGGVQFSRGQAANDQSAFLSALANLAVVVGFAAFAYSVKYVLKNVACD